MGDFFFILLQRIVPQHLISRLIGKIACSKYKIIKNTFIFFFLKNYDIKMQEALEENPYHYKSFNAFFTRLLKPEVREFIQDKKVIICPVDGKISQFGAISSERIIQAKDRSFNLVDFLGGDEDLEKEFKNGDFFTAYLSPKDYHRVHMPFSGILRCMSYIPGDLFSVNPSTVSKVNNLFARNERLVCIFDTNDGPIAITLVGAMIVAGIKVNWENADFKKNRKIQKWVYPKNGKGSVFLEKGKEFGKFFLGSTVILCFPNKKINWDKGLNLNTNVRLGQIIATY